MVQYAAFVMTYNRPEILRQTLHSVANQTCPPSRILVVDNGDGTAALDVVQTMDSDIVGYHSMGENMGPAGASAYALKRLADEGYEWINWVDDDNPPMDETTMEDLINLAISNDAPVGGVGTVGSRFNWSTGELERLPDGVLFGTLEVDMIAGGQQLILNSNIVRDVGVSDSRLFFGLEEMEYCLRIRRAGYRLLVDGQTMLEQRVAHGRTNLGQIRAVVPTISARDAWRYYYRTRNYIYMMRTTFHRSDLARRESVKALGRCFTCWRRGTAFGKHFVPLQLLGIRDGYLANMGRTIEPQSK